MDTRVRCRAESVFQLLRRTIPPVRDHHFATRKIDKAGEVPLVVPLVCQNCKILSLCSGGRFKRIDAFFSDRINFGIACKNL
jgi:hypothetical protein